MHRIAVRYSRFRHRALATVGHLFERRYRAKLVDVDRYFVAVLRYVHMNPVKAGLAMDPAQYPWSSHRAYLGLESPTWVTTAFGLALFSTDRDRARVAYAAFMNTPVEPDELDALDETIAASQTDPRIIGTDEFARGVSASHEGSRSSSSLPELAAAICARHGIGVSIIRSPAALRSLTPIRVEIARAAVENRVATLAEVARYLGRDPSTLYQLLKRHLAYPQLSNPGTDSKS
jgi:hypothetical protein